MTSAQKAFNVVILLAVLALGVFAAKPAATDKFGSSFYESYPIQFGGGLQIGQNGSVLAKAVSGTCNPTIASAALPVAATSTVLATCAVPSAAVGDKVFVTLPAGSATSYNGFSMHAAYVASAGSIGIVLENLTGTATSSFPLATTSVQYWIVR